MKRSAMLLLLAMFAGHAVGQETFLQVPPDSTGKKLRMRSATVGLNTVYTQGFFIDNGSGGGPLGINTNPIFVDFAAGATLAITAASLPLPAGAATESGNLATIATNTGRIPSSPATDRTSAGAPFSLRLSDGTSFYKATTPSDTQPVSAIALPLPTGAATSAAQTDGSAKTQIVHSSTGAEVLETAPGSDTGQRGLAVRVISQLGAGAGGGGGDGKILDGTATGQADVIGSAPSGTEQALVVRNIPSGTQPVSGPLTDAQLRATAIPISGTVTANAGSGTMAVSAATLPLPSGAATETTLAGIKTGTDKIPASPATDRATAAAPFSMRLSDGSAFYKATTPADTQPTQEANTATADFDSGAGTVTQRMIGIAVPASGGPVAGGTSSNPIRVDPTGTTTQPISAISLPLATGASTLAEQQTQTTSLQTIDDTQVATGTTAPAKVNVMGGKTSDGTPQYQPLPLTNGGAAVKIDGTATTQPVSASTLPLPTGAATETTLAGIKTGTDKIPASPATDRATAAAPFSMRLSDGTSFYKATTPSDTQPVSGTVTSNAGTGTFATTENNTATADYDSGAGTVTQRMIGIAVPASGGPVAGGTATAPVRTDPTGTTTQPVSGTVTSNIGTTNGIALDATLTGGTQKAIARGGAKGSTSAADVTSEAVDANVQALHVFMKNTSIAVTGTFWQATQPVSGSITANQGTANTAANRWPMYISDGTNTMPTLDAAARRGFMQISDGTNNVTATGTSLNVNCTGGCTPGGSFGDSTAFTFGSSAIGNMGAVVDDTATNTVAENSAGAPRMSANRILYTQETSGGSAIDVRAITSVVPGTAATNLGKAEDAAHASGDVGVLAMGVRKDDATQVTSADGEYSFFAADAYGAQFTRSDHPNRVTCSATGIAATLTQMTGCAAQAGLSYYITSLAFQSTTATSGTFAVQSGTATNCGTTTTAVFPNSATGNRFNAPPTTAGMANVSFPIPIKVTQSHAVCLIGVATNTTSLQLTGFLAP